MLVDEAQDTNPEQWAILRAITQEFAAGEGARTGSRTRFAVGDPKQSIYGFQGAEPREFALTRASWIAESRAAGLTFEDVPLTLSFRSTSLVLRAVDAVFALDAHNEGLSFEDTVRETVHDSARPGAPGAVELWPIAEPEPAAEPDAWTAPVDAPETSAPAIVTARRVAQAVRDWTTSGDAAGRVWRPGDVLILVRKRGPAFEEVIRALKRLGVPVAGQDRLEVSAHIAVADLVAAGRAGLLPADDLTLATALKSPLVGLTDDDLVRIAARRDIAETLEDALHRHAATGDAAAAPRAGRADRVDRPGGTSRAVRLLRPAPRAAGWPGEAGRPARRRGGRRHRRVPRRRRSGGNRRGCALPRRLPGAATSVPRPGTRSSATSNRGATRSGS